MREQEPVRALLFLHKTSRFDTGAVCSHTDSILREEQGLSPSQRSFNSMAVLIDWQVYNRSLFVTAELQIMCIFRLTDGRIPWRSYDNA
jgi:hypothetical protein